MLRRPIHTMSAAPSVQRACAGCEQEDEKVRGKPSGSSLALSPDLAGRIEGARGGGAPLPPATRAFFGPRFGCDFDGVRVHTGAGAQSMAGELGAHAFTVGRDVYFNAGRYAPSTDAGQRLLAHELTHVVQQTRAGAQSRERTVSDPESAAEREAGSAANRVVGGAHVAVNQAPAAGVHRDKPSGKTPQTVTITANDESPPACQPNSMLALNWKIAWATSGRNGFIVQEIDRTRWGRKCGTKEKLTELDTERFWEAWSVDSKGAVTPPYDFWITPVFPNIETRFSVDGKAFWVDALDPKAGFAPKTSQGNQLVAKKKPTNLGSVLLSRHQAGAFFDCDERHCELDKPKAKPDPKPKKP